MHSCEAAGVAAGSPALGRGELGRGEDASPSGPYLGAAPDVFSTDVQLCQKPVNLVKFIFLIASVFYNGAFNLFFLCLLGFLLSGTFRPPFFSRWK